VGFIQTYGGAASTTTSRRTLCKTNIHQLKQSAFMAFYLEKTIESYKLIATL
jgi:hypothetical protein